MVVSVWVIRVKRVRVVGRNTHRSAESRARSALEPPRAATIRVSTCSSVGPRLQWCSLTRPLHDHSARSFAIDRYAKWLKMPQPQPSTRRDCRVGPRRAVHVPSRGALRAECRRAKHPTMQLSQNPRDAVGVQQPTLPLGRRSRSA